MTFPVGIFPLRFFREIFPMRKKINRILFFSQNWKLYLSKYISNWFHPSNSKIIFFPWDFLPMGKFLTKIPMGFFNKIQNLFLPLIKLRLDCVSSYYVLLNVFHVILSNSTSFLIYITKDWNMFYFTRLLNLARIMNVLGDRFELLSTVLYFFLQQSVKCLKQLQFVNFFVYIFPRCLTDSFFLSRIPAYVLS